MLRMKLQLLGPGRGSHKLHLISSQFPWWIGKVVQFGVMKRNISKHLRSLKETLGCEPQTQDACTKLL